MAFSNLVAFFIILTTAVTLNTAGITDITTSADAAEALRPIAGNFAFLLFSLGIIGTGLLALPVLAGSAAYAIGELFGWRIGLEERPRNARAFYGTIALGFASGAPDALSADRPDQGPVLERGPERRDCRAADGGDDDRRHNRAHLGPFVAPRAQRSFGWLATATMAAAALAMVLL